MESHGKVGALFTELNEAHSELNRTNSENMHLTLELEERVARRTAELDQINQALREEIRRGQLTAAAARLQLSAMSAAANGIVITNREGAIEWVNPAFSKLTGYSLEEALGKNPRELLKSGVHSLIEYERLWATILSGRIWHGFLVNRRKDGSRYNEEQTITPVLGEGGSITHFIAIKQDMTERIKAREALRLSEERYRLLVDNAPDAICVLSDKMDIVSTNRGFQNILGFKGHALEGTPYADMIHPDDRSRASMLLDGVLMDRKEATFELRLKTAIGTYCEVDVAAFSNQLSNGILQVRLIFRDVTSRNAKERLLRDQNEILTRSHEGVMIANLSNKVTLWNSAAAELFGWTREEAIGRSPEEILGIEKPEIVEELRSAAAQRRYWNGELQARSRAGRVVILDLRVTIVNDGFGSPMSRLILFTDITEKKQFEEQALRAQRLENLGMLAAGIAHDFNNALAPIVMAAPLLRSKISDQQTLHMVDIVEKSSARGASLVRQMLGFARGSASERQVIQVRHVLREVIDLCRASFPKAIAVADQLPRDLWAVAGEATQFQQVFMNLCVNARDSMPNGGILSITASNQVVGPEMDLLDSRRKDRTIPCR